MRGEIMRRRRADRIWKEMPKKQRGFGPLRGGRDLRTLDWEESCNQGVWFPVYSYTLQFWQMLKEISGPWPIVSSKTQSEELPVRCALGFSLSAPGGASVRKGERRLYEREGDWGWIWGITWRLQLERNSLLLPFGSGCFFFSPRGRAASEEIILNTNEPWLHDFGQVIQSETLFSHI